MPLGMLIRSVNGEVSEYDARTAWCVECVALQCLSLTLGDVMNALSVEMLGTTSLVLTENFKAM